MNSELESLGELLTESSIDAMIAIDMQHDIIAWNNAASLLFDVRKEKAIGNSIFTVLKSVNEDAALITAIGFAKEGKKSFLPATNDFSHRQHIETHVVPLSNASSVIGIMMLLHDVSHRIVKEEQLQHLNSELQKKLKELKRSNRELADLTHIASHDIKEPIRNIYTTIEKLIRTDARNLSDNSKAAFRRMQASLNRMNLLLDDIITLAQINLAEKPETVVNIEDILQDIRKMLEPKLRENQAEIKNGDLCEIKAHRNQLVLLLQNVLSYAIKHNNAINPVFEIHCRKTNDGNFNEMMISYNGDHLETTSIALVIASRIMEAHNGFLQTEKNENHTLIKCFFPIE